MKPAPAAPIVKKEEPKKDVKSLTAMFEKNFKAQVEKEVKKVIDTHEKTNPF